MGSLSTFINICLRHKNIETLKNHYFIPPNVHKSLKKQNCVSTFFSLRNEQECCTKFWLNKYTNWIKHTVYREKKTNEWRLSEEQSSPIHYRLGIKISGRSPTDWPTNQRSLSGRLVREGVFCGSDYGTISPSLLIFRRQLEAVLFRTTFDLFSFYLLPVLTGVLKSWAFVYFCNCFIHIVFIVFFTIILFLL